MLKFVGQPGEFLPGVPARDLTDEEAKQYPEAPASPLYMTVISGGGATAGRKKEIR